MRDGNCGNVVMAGNADGALGNGNEAPTTLLAIILGDL